MEHIAVYYDYTCPYSYRALRWLAEVAQAKRQLTVTWRTFSLKEANRQAGQASFLSGAPGESVSILALELGKATQSRGPEAFEAYHHRVFGEMQGYGRKLATTDLLTIAQEAGLDIARR